MSYNFPAARAQAKRIITKFGKPGEVILKGVSGGFDDNGDVTPDTPDTIIKGTITPLIQFKTKEIDGESILKGDSWVYFDSDTEPQINMQITLNGKTLRIIQTFPLSSVDDVNIFRKLQLRK